MEEDSQIDIPNSQSEFLEKELFSEEVWSY